MAAASSTEFRMPKLGADMTEGRLVEWLKKPGEPIARGEVIAVVETDKANVDVEAWAPGTIEKILVEPGPDWMPVGTPLAILRAEAPVEAVPAAGPAAAPVPEGRVPPKPTPVAAVTPPAAPAPPTRPRAAAPAAAVERVHISPVARRRAEALGIDPASLTGTGPDGRITLADVERAAQAPARPPAPAPTKAERMREAIAAAMARSKREIPHYYLATTIDMSKALAWLAQTNAGKPVTERLLYGVLLLKATALALREVPELNGFWRDGRAQPSSAVHVGVAISLRGGGLVAPALHDADKASLPELMRRFQDLVQRARAGSLRGSEMTDPTVTVTSLGERGVESVFGVIYPPQLALVGFGKIVERPWVAEGQVAARPVMTATLSADHRATDGHRGALFLDALDRLLQAPDKL